jgi:hypothetical protein
MLRWWENAHGLRWTALRYFNAAGADPDGDIGEDHEPETHLVPLAVQAAMGTRGPLEIFGSDYGTQDGTAVRDYIHVSDLAAAHVAALKRLRPEAAVSRSISVPASATRYATSSAWSKFSVGECRCGWALGAQATRHSSLPPRIARATCSNGSPVTRASMRSSPPRGAGTRITEAASLVRP